MYRVQRLLTYIVLSIILLSGVYASLPNPTAYYNFDNVATVGSILKDISGDYNLSLINSPTTGVAGISNQSYLFNRTDNQKLNSIAVFNNLNPNSNKSYSANLWVKASEICLGVNCGLLQWGSTGVTGKLIISGANNKLFYYENGASSEYFFGSTGDDTILTNGSWHMVTLTRNESNNEVKLYINGNVRGSHTMTLQNLTGNIFRVGYDGVDAENYEGYIDEVAIFQNIVLSSEKINELYNNGTGVFCSGDPCVFPSGNPTPVISNNFIVIAKDAETGENISYNRIKFNITFTNGTTQEFYNGSGNSYKTPYLVNESKIVNVLGINNISNYNYFTNDANSPDFPGDPNFYPLQREYFNTYNTNVNTSSALELNFIPKNYPIVISKARATNFTGIFGASRFNFTIYLPNGSTNFFQTSEDNKSIPYANQSFFIDIISGKPTLGSSVQWNFPTNDFNVNISNPMYLYFIMNEFKVNAFDIYNKQVIGNITVNTTREQNIYNGLIKQNLEPYYFRGEYNGTVNFNRFGKSETYVNAVYANVLTNITYNITGWYDTILNITLKDLFTDTKVKNFTASISDNGITYSKETTNGSILFEVTKGSEYNLSVGSNEYVNTSVLYNVTGFNPIYNFTAYTERTINITLRDESTDNILTENMTVEILGDEIRTKTTTSGNLIFQLLAPDTYNIRYFSTNNLDYQLRQKSFTVLPDQIYNLDLYSLNTSANNVGVVNVLIYDNAYNKVLGADVRLTKQNSVTGQFEEVSQCNTNSDGLCSFTVILGAETYIITATDTINGNTFTGQNSQSGVIFYNDNAQITIRLNGEPNYQVNDVFDLVVNVYNKSLVNNISYLSAIYVNGVGASSTVCVEYFLQSGTTSNSLAKYCSTGSSGVIPTTVLLNRSYTNMVKVYALSDGTEQVYYTNIYTAEQSAQGYFGWMAKYLIFGVLILGLGISVLLKQIILYPIFAVIGILVSWIVFPTFITIADVSIVILLAIGIVYLSTKNTGDNNV